MSTRLYAFASVGSPGLEAQQGTPHSSARALQEGVRQSGVKRQARSRVRGQQAQPEVALWRRRHGQLLHHGVRRCGRRLRLQTPQVLGSFQALARQNTP